MNSHRIGAIDREFVTHYFATYDHHVQNTLAWFDFLKSYSQETDRSATLYLNDQPVGFVLALQYKRLIQSLPYPASYAGVFFLPEIKRETRCALIQQLFEHYTEFADVFSICTSPLSSDGEPCEEHFDFVSDNKILYIDLSHPLLTGTTSKFRNNFKRNLRKAKDAGVIVTDVSDDTMLKAWYCGYEKRMEELESVTLEYDYFVALRNHLQPNEHFKLFNARIGDRYLGGIVIVYNHFCADYYLSIFDREADETQASTCLFYHALSWARDQRITFFNLQASPVGQDALYDFKKSWGATAGSHQYLVKIMNNRDEILRSSPDQVRREYRFHYLAPFQALTDGITTRNIEQRNLQGSR
jgi:hypothetical protein